MWMCVLFLVFRFFFFFKQYTAYDMRISDWGSDVCSSDLAGRGIGDLVDRFRRDRTGRRRRQGQTVAEQLQLFGVVRGAAVGAAHRWRPADLGRRQAAARGGGRFQAAGRLPPASRQRGDRKSVVWGKRVKESDEQGW